MRPRYSLHLQWRDSHEINEEPVTTAGSLQAAQDEARDLARCATPHVTEALLVYDRKRELWLDRFPTRPDEEVV